MKYALNFVKSGSENGVKVISEVSGTEPHFPSPNAPAEPAEIPPAFARTLKMVFDRALLEVF